MKKDIAKYQADKKAYDAALEECNTQKLTYGSKVFEKASADKTTAETKGKYYAEISVYNISRVQYDKDLQ